tara:strand:+ start:253 stop:474 length:222 start_codon:yes stop_codon:yes gene_type:complete
MTSSQKRQRRQNRHERGNTIKNLVIGTLGGLILATALYAPMLITIEPATPNGVNVMFGDLGGYHIATTTESNQ